MDESDDGDWGAAGNGDEGCKVAARVVGWVKMAGGGRGAAGGGVGQFPAGVVVEAEAGPPPGYGGRALPITTGGGPGYGGASKAGVTIPPPEDNGDRI